MSASNPKAPGILKSGGGGDMADFISDGISAIGKQRMPSAAIGGAAPTL
jgi:hypothetical protein